MRAKARSYFDRAESISRVVANIEQKTVEEIASEDIAKTFCYWYIPEGIRLQSSTFDEMTATGSLDLLRDNEIRQLLQLAWSEHRRAKEENPKLSAYQSDLAKPLRSFTVWQFDAPRQSIDQNPNNVPISAGCRVDRQALATDPKITSLLVQLNRSQIILGNLHLNEQRALESLLAALERAQSSQVFQ